MQFDLAELPQEARPLHAGHGVPPAKVLIAGAGPTGLVLALWLTRLGVPVRIIDKAAQPGTTSRALVVHARTLELYRELGLAEELLAGGLRFEAINLWVRGEKAGRAALGDAGRGVSPFPFLLIHPQDEHERVLIGRLKTLGVEVERGTELADFREEGERVVARLRRADGSEEQCEAQYLAGCDGASSKVREVLHAGFPGGTYAHLFYVADVEARGEAVDGELHVALDDADFLAIFPLKGAGRARLVGTVSSSAELQHQRLGWEDVSTRVIERMRLQVDRVHWFSTYHVHHRVSARFRWRRAFLLGDAAHIHSPVGGQGMNTGIADAANLAWKLAFVLRGGVRPELLDSYEPERLAFAKRLVATTDRAFTFVTNDGPLARMMRTEVVPRVLPRLFHSKAVRRLMFRTVSQTLVNYRASGLSEGRAGAVRGGDRLPWVPALEPSGEDNFAALSPSAWQVHVYGNPRASLRDACMRRRLPLRVFDWRPAIRRTGLQRDAAYLVRPDGYVALASSKATGSDLDRYIDRHLQA
jgi:2-polyprenyl-6-methoxyphenol hydroxylase-like FAD-dependent oxidoreductase